MRKIELLSPAKNIDCGIAAINHGADAVYIGADQFSARAAAGNSVEDIEKLVRYAHLYGAKVLVAVNTLLTDAQLEEAEKLIWRVYETGADALIIQDMGILKMNLPPIALHASTQTDNRSVEKVKFLQDVGFSRVVLARELSSAQIKKIAAQTDVELEAFVHGALCVSYSGQCYISQAMCGRSANRGQCAQFCRLSYDLLDSDKNVLIAGKHILSLKDLDMSAHLAEMIEAGISSFKIEGRLKEQDYVKNITAYYRQKLDAVLDNKPVYKRASDGKTVFFFEPNPEKSFRRGNTDYFFSERQPGLSQPDTPKSLGEPIGKVRQVYSNYLEVENGEMLNNGDGICFLDEKDVLKGCRVNRTEGRRVFPNEIPRIIKNAMVYRNQDHEFEKALQRKTSERRIAVDIFLKETANGFQLKIVDETNIEILENVELKKQPAQKPEKVKENIVSQLSKLGDTVFKLRNIDIDIEQAWFFPISTLNEWRRKLIDALLDKRWQSYQREKARQPQSAIFPEKTVSYLGNVTNRLSEVFYKEHGVEEIQAGFEIEPPENVPLMMCRYCIKYEYGWCPKQKNVEKQEPLYLRDNKQQLFRLHFVCGKCEMLILK